MKKWIFLYTCFIILGLCLQCCGVNCDDYPNKTRRYEELFSSKYRRFRHHRSRMLGKEMHPYVGPQKKSHRRRSDRTDSGPRFAGEMKNVTAALGREARLECIVDNLHPFRIAWLRLETKTILAIHRHVISRNYRITLGHDDGRTWSLHISNVQEEDRGGYMCQVNTVPMLSQIGYLDVVVPPDIIDTESSSDVFANEGSNVTLACRAKGYPTPTITWRREDHQPVVAGNWQEDLYQSEDIRAKKNTTVHKGDKLTIRKVSRLHMGAYLCIASNGVPPSVSRRIMLQVNFTPMIWIPNQLVGAPLHGKVSLDCHTEAHPTSINYWMKDTGEVVLNTSDIDVIFKINSYKTHMVLTFHRLKPSDFASYKCTARNSLGETEGSIRLYEIHVPQQIKEPSTAKIQSVDGTSANGPIDIPDDAKAEEPAQKYANSSIEVSDMSSDGRQWHISASGLLLSVLVLCLKSRMFLLGS